MCMSIYVKYMYLGMQMSSILSEVCVSVSVTLRYCITRSSAIAEGLREALISRNPATTKHLT